MTRLQMETTLAVLGDDCRYVAQPKHLIKGLTNGSVVWTIHRKHTPLEGERS